MSKWSEWELANGIRVVHVYETISQVAHCGLMVNTGSRDEAPDEQGMAHFIEHAIFKGTKKRKAFHVLNRIDSVGGELNAYTSKEETAIYASFSKEHFARAIELIADVAFHSVFPEKELEKEKEVVIDELNAYMDSPSEQIFDDFEELLFEGHPIGRNILGTAESVRSFSREQLLKFITRNYSTNEMVISVVGNVKPKQVVYFIEKFFANLPASHRKKDRNFNVPLQPSVKTIERNTFQAHFISGVRAYLIGHPLQATLALVNNMIGGPAMNTRLHMQLREKRGIAYHVESNYQPYTDTGVNSIYIGTDKKSILKCKRVIRNELDALRNKFLGVNQLAMAKAQLKGQVLLNNESRVNTMLGLAKSVLHVNEIKTDEQIVAEIDAITASQVAEVVNELWVQDRVYELCYR